MLVKESTFIERKNAAFFFGGFGCRSVLKYDINTIAMELGVLEGNLCLQSSLHFPTIFIHHDVKLIKTAATEMLEVKNNTARLTTTNRVSVTGRYRVSSKKRTF